jgi:hypothetical protein
LSGEGETRWSVVGAKCASNPQTPDLRQTFPEGLKFGSKELPEEAGKICGAARV